MGEFNQWLGTFLDSAASSSWPCFSPHLTFLSDPSPILRREGGGGGGVHTHAHTLTGLTSNCLMSHLNLALHLRSGGKNDSTSFTRGDEDVGDQIIHGKDNGFSSPRPPEPWGPTSTSAFSTDSSTPRALPRQLGPTFPPLLWQLLPLPL